jgi:serine kinase
MASKKDPIELDPKTEAVLKRKDYVVKEMISSGSYGKVYKAQKKSDLIFSAVKVMDMDAMDARFREEFLPRELEMLKTIKHPYVLEVFDIIKANRKIYIFMEFASNGDLAHQCQDGAPPVARTKEWISQSAQALAYMHDSLNICHRDIKLENVLLNVLFDAKLSDFGFSRAIGNSLARTVCGTAAYYSPELTTRSYDPKKADVWALGCVLFALCLVRLPFAEFPGKIVNGRKIPDDENGLAAYRKIQNQRVYRQRPGYSKLPADMRDLIEKCMEPDPRKRLTAAQIVVHKALK